MQRTLVYLDTTWNAFENDIENGDTIEEMDIYEEQPERLPSGRDEEGTGGEGEGQEVSSPVHSAGSGDSTDDGDDTLAGVSGADSEEDVSDTEEVDWDEHSSVGWGSPGSDEGDDPAKQGVLFQGGQGPLACWIRTGGEKAWKAYRPPGLHEGGPGGIWGPGTGCGLPRCPCTLPQLRGKVEEGEEDEGYGGDDEGRIQGRDLERLAEACIREAGDAIAQANSVGVEQGGERGEIVPGTVHRGYEEGFHVQHGEARGHHLRLQQEDAGVRGDGPFKRASGASAILGHGRTEERLPILRKVRKLRVLLQTLEANCLRQLPAGEGEAE